MVCFIIQFYHPSENQIVLESRENFIDLSLILCINLAVNSLSYSSDSLQTAYNYFPCITCKPFQMHLSHGNPKALEALQCVFQWLQFQGAATPGETITIHLLSLRDVVNCPMNQIFFPYLFLFFPPHCNCSTNYNNIKKENYSKMVFDYKCYLYRIVITADFFNE